MWIEVEHELRFRYDGFVRESRMELRVEPRTSDQQTLQSFALAVGPPAKVQRYVDWVGNYVHHFGIGGYHDRILVTGASLVQTHPQGRDLERAEAPPPARAELGELLEFTAFGGPVTRSERLEQVSAALATGAAGPLRDQIRAIGAFIRDRLRYQRGVTDVASSSDDVLEAGAGVCQDFAHLMLGLLRLRGIPCRYVSGYLHAEGGEPAQSHAWVEVHAGAAGWVGFDPTHDQAPDERYVVVGWGRSYADVPPNRGVFRGLANEQLEARVRTREAAPPEVPGVREEISPLDVPVFREAPSPSQEDAREAELEQQQQQQQQRGPERPRSRRLTR